MRRAIIQHDVSRQAWADSSLDKATWPPVDPVYVTGPRGGRYVAIGPWERRVSEDGERWDRNLLTVAYISAGVRYIRPKRK